MLVCPCCNGKGEIEQITPVPLTRMQTKIYEIVAAAKDRGIAGPDLIRKVYEDRFDGGPDYGDISVHVTLMRMNKRLASAKQAINCTVRGRGGVFKLVRL